MRCQTSTDSPNDGELLLRYRSGDDSALGELFERYESTLFRFLYGMLKDRHRAEDALQETFVQAVRKCEQVQPESLRGWLFTVAHQQALLSKRQGKRYEASNETPDLVPDQRQSPADVLAWSNDLAVAKSLLAELPESQQTVIRMRIFDGLRFQDVADRLGLPLGTALARMHDGLKKMRALWEKRYA